MHSFQYRKNLPELNITFDNNRIKQFHMVEHLNCYLGTNLSGESIVMKSVKMINTKLQFLYGQNEFLSHNKCNF